MKESIDCAVLMLPPHTPWMTEFMDAFIELPGSARGRLTLHPLGANGTRFSFGGRMEPAWPADSLRKAALQLKRYDACLVPVTLETLGWTRMALADARPVLQTPLIGLSRDLKAAGLQDLYAQGMVDFLRHPVCPEELKIRMMHLVGSGSTSYPPPAPTSVHTLAESLSVSPVVSAPVWMRKPLASALQGDVGVLARLPSRGEPFRTAKARLVTEFERHYIVAMLAQHRGNISQAAKASHKNRRAFWELMRKHEIVADGYREPAQR